MFTHPAAASLWHDFSRAGLEFLRVVPTVWDDTKIVDGLPGEFVISAQRSGRDWFVGGMTNWDSRTIEDLAQVSRSWHV